MNYTRALIPQDARHTATQEDKPSITLVSCLMFSQAVQNYLTGVPCNEDIEVVVVQFEARGVIHSHYRREE